MGLAGGLLGLPALSSRGLGGRLLGQGAIWLVLATRTLAVIYH